MSATTAIASPSHTMWVPSPESELPLLFDSPHSGHVFPADFDTLATPAELATAWDAYVEELWSGVVPVGGSLLAAHFPRVVIDPNRAESDIDPALLAGDWPTEWGQLQPTAYSERGMGLMRRHILPGRPMYAAPLSVEQVQWRLASLYRPYHEALAGRLEALQTRFGTVWHIDCHSMKSSGNAMNIDNGKARPDFVLGDLDGRSCAKAFTDIVATELLKRGYTVSRNDPYKGGYIVQRYHNPAAGRHCLQIEINRRLYLDETNQTKTTGFAQLQADLGALSAILADYIRATVD